MLPAWFSFELQLSRLELFIQHEEPCKPAAHQLFTNGESNLFHSSSNTSALVGGFFRLTKCFYVFYNSNGCANEPKVSVLNQIRDVSCEVVRGWVREGSVTS